MAWRPNELEARLNELRSELQLGSVTSSTLLEYLVGHTPLAEVKLDFLQPIPAMVICASRISNGR